MNCSLLFRSLSSTDRLICPCRMPGSATSRPPGMIMSAVQTLVSPHILGPFQLQDAGFSDLQAIRGDPDLLPLRGPELDAVLGRRSNPLARLLGGFGRK